MALSSRAGLAGPDTTVIVVSDHGFHSDHLRPTFTPRVPAGVTVWHRKQGVFAASGPGLLADELVHGASLLDVTPTILALFGLPVGERHLEFYDQIDFARIRQRAEARSSAGDVEDDVLALSCQDLAASDEMAAPEPESNRPSHLGRLRPLRPDTMLRFLERKFGCQVQRGKGSEITIFRPGGKKFRLGHPKQVQPEHLKRILRRLGIPIGRWLSATRRRFRGRQALAAHP